MAWISVAVVWATLCAAVAPVRAGGGAAAPSLRPWAQGVSKASQARALELYQEGNRWFADQQYARAAEVYQAALRWWDHPAIRYNLAVSQLALGQSREALSNLRRGMAFGAAPLGPKLHARGRGLLELLESQLVQLSVSCGVAGSVLRLNGGELGACPGRYQVVLESGRHVVVASKPGYPEARRVLTVRGGARRDLQLDVARNRIGVDAAAALSPLGVGDAFGVGFGGFARGERQLSSSLALLARVGVMYRRPRFDEAAFVEVPLWIGLERLWDVGANRPFVEVDVGGHWLYHPDEGSTVVPNLNLGAGVAMGSLELRASMWWSRRDEYVLVLGTLGYTFAAR